MTVDNRDPTHSYVCGRVHRTGTYLYDRSSWLHLKSFFNIMSRITDRRLVSRRWNAPKRLTVLPTHSKLHLSVRDVCLACLVGIGQLAARIVSHVATLIERHCGFVPRHSGVALAFLLREPVRVKSARRLPRAPTSNIPYECDSYEYNGNTSTDAYTHGDILLRIPIMQHVEDDSPGSIDDGIVALTSEECWRRCVGHRRARCGGQRHCISAEGCD